MQIFVKTLNVETSELLNDVKAKIQEKEGIPIHLQILNNGTRILENDNKSLEFYKVSNESTLHMSLRWNGKNAFEDHLNTMEADMKTAVEIEQEKEERNKVAIKKNIPRNLSSRGIKKDACEEFKDKLEESMKCEMNKELVLKTTQFKKLEKERIEINVKVSELNEQREKSNIEYQERKETNAKCRGDLWEDYCKANSQKIITDKKIKMLQSESEKLELVMTEKMSKVEIVDREHASDTQQTLERNSKIDRERDSYIARIKDIEKEKDGLFKKKKVVNEAMVDFLTNTIEEKKKELECPVCLETSETPIYKCRMDHLVCTNCRPDLKTCPECRKPYSKTPVRHRFAEKLDEEIKKLSMDLKTILDVV